MKSLGPPFLIAALQRRPKVLILSFTATVLLTVATLQTASLWLRHDRVIESAEARVGNLAFVLAEYVRGSFALADASLRQLSIHARRVGGSTAPGEAWDAILASARASQPGSGSISVTDANGVIRRSTQPAIVGQSRRDNYVFKQLAASDRDELVVDRPFLSPVEPKRFLIPIGRRLVDGRGHVRRDGRGCRHAGGVSRVLPHGGRRRPGHHLRLPSRRRRAVSRAIREGSDGRDRDGKPDPPDR